MREYLERKRRWYDTRTAAEKLAEKLLVEKIKVLEKK